MSIERKYVQDGIEYCWCAKHKGYEPCGEFSPSKRSSNGHNYYCRKCISINKVDRTKFPRYKVENDIEYCWCSQHMDYHPCTDFQKCKKSHGYQYNCREINALIYTDRTNQYTSGRDLFIAKQLLELMGYKTDGDISVHEQFQNKFNL